VIKGAVIRGALPSRKFYIVFAKKLIDVFTQFVGSFCGFWVEIALLSYIYRLILNPTHRNDAPYRPSCFCDSLPGFVRDKQESGIHAKG
jgi:hypothetical protein